MTRPLRQLDVLVLDCQASGATPELGAMLEIGWTIARPLDEAPSDDALLDDAPLGASMAAEDAERAPITAVTSHFVVPPEGHRVPPFVQRLLGWSRACLDGALLPDQVWSRLGDALPAKPAATVIHYASFELPFLRDLHARFGAEAPFPLEVTCLHAIARRLYPDLPRRSLRALAGFLGHTPSLLRRSSGHVEASAFVWRALVPVLEREGVTTWEDLGSWLDAPAPKRSAKRVYPMPADKRRALPDAPGVYRFVRSNGDVLYVGKAASLKKRVASHFAASAKKPERALEMLTQALDVVVTETASALEAALLEADEIKRLDPPYNVHLREGDRRAWFASADLAEATTVADDAHRLGPLPSEGALDEFAAIGALVRGAELTAETAAAAIGAPAVFAPPVDLFAAAWPEFVVAHRLRVGRHGTPWRSMMRAARALFAIRGTLESPDEDDFEARGWDRERVRRHLDRSLLRGGHLVRRARWLTALADSAVVYREADAETRRLLFLAGAEITRQEDTAADAPIPAPAKTPPRARRAAFDAARYDRVRTLATELERVHAEGGLVRIRIGDRVIEGARLDPLLRWA